MLLELILTFPRTIFLSVLSPCKGKGASPLSLDIAALPEPPVMYGRNDSKGACKRKQRLAGVEDETD